MGCVLEDAELLLPVPLHWSRLWARRFNQAAMLARAIGRQIGKPALVDGLVRQRLTPSQVGLDAKARQENVRNAFAVRPSRSSDVFGRRIVLVDDVLTTGATAGACAKALKSAGAAQVDVVVFALVLDPPKGHV